MEIGESQLSKVVIENVGNAIAQDVVVTVSSDGLSVHLTKKMGDIPPGQSKDVDFHITARHAGRYRIFVCVKYHSGPAEYTDFAEKYVDVLQFHPSLAYAHSSAQALEDVVVDLTSDVVKARVGQEFSLTLSVVNLIKNPNMTLQVILRPPSGMSVVSSEFAQSGVGIYTGTFFVKPGESKAVKITVVPNNAGNFTIKGTIVYYFGNDKKNATVREISIPIEVVKAENDKNSKLPNFKIPGFSVVLAITGLIGALTWMVRLNGGNRGSN